MQTCCVIGCKRNKNLSTFRIPTDNRRRAEWLKKLPNIPRSNFCCEKHFEKKYIIDENVVNRNTSKNYLRKQLKSNAIPTIFEKSTFIEKPKPIEPPKPVFIDPIKVGHVLHDTIGTFTELQQNIQDRLRLQNFQVQIKTNEIFLFDFNKSGENRLTVRTSVVISNTFDVIIHFNGLKQKLSDVSGIFGAHFRLVLYSQLQKLINKYTAMLSANTIGTCLEEFHENVGESSKLITKTPETSQQIKIYRQNAITSLKTLQNAINGSGLFKFTDLSYIIEQVRLSKRVKQPMFKIETIIQSYLIYCHIGNAYDTLRNQNMITLPLQSTMELLTSLDVQPHLLADIKKATYLRSDTLKMVSHEKFINLQIQEIYYTGRLSVRASNANCSATSVLCFIMNSIFGEMKKIVYLQPICDITASELYTITMSVIERIQKLKLTVLSVTANQNITTKQLYDTIISSHTLNDQQNNIFHMANGYRFSNPMHQNEYIYLLYNPASVLTNIRNDWIDQIDQQKTLKYPNFDTGDIKLASFSHLYELFESESDMLIKTATKINQETVYPNANDRELFSYTLNVFDMSTIVALRTASDGYNSTVDLLNLINMWWTIMDIRNKTMAILHVHNENILLLKSLIEWIRKWKMMNDNNDSGRLTNETYDALLQTSVVMLALMSFIFEEQQLKLEFYTSKFHTDDMEPFFSKYKEPARNPIF